MATRRRRIRGSRMHDTHPIAKADRARTFHVGVQRQLAVQTAADVPQHLMIASERIRIHGRHRAASAQHTDVTIRNLNTTMRRFPVITPLQERDMQDEAIGVVTTWFEELTSG
jgi:hypothetical protein